MWLVCAIINHSSYILNHKSITFCLDGFMICDVWFQIYDFFLPGLLIHTIECKTNKPLLKWIDEIVNNGYNVVTMLGCHDGIPVLDLKGKEIEGSYFGLRKREIQSEEPFAVLSKMFL